MCRVKRRNDDEMSHHIIIIIDDFALQEGNERWLIALLVLEHFI